MKTFTGLLFVLVVASCGGEPQDGLSDIEVGNRGVVSGNSGEAFIGTWRLTSETMSANCGDYSPDPNVRAISLVWRKGTTPDLVATGAGGFCSLTARVTASTASAAAGQGCIASDGAYGLYAISRTRYTFTLSPDAETAQSDSAGTVEYSDSGVVSMTCAYLGTATYQKVPEAPEPTNSPSPGGANARAR